jgi:hypothetical protein
VRIVALGDSITRAVRQGVAAEETFAALLEAELRNEKIEAELINAGFAARGAGRPSRIGAGGPEHPAGQRDGVTGT